MMKIGVLSDTHGYWDPKYQKYFENCDQIWHAGDIGSSEVLFELQKIAETRAVHGNIDDAAIRMLCPETLNFKVEDVDVMLVHIGGYPRHYDRSAAAKILSFRPKLFVCGHSHILKVMFDQSLQMLCINPGAAGISGFHNARTILRFEIDGRDIRNMEVIELSNSRNPQDILQ
jgi:putative phosphoesterase